MGYWRPVHGGGWQWMNGNLTQGSNDWYLTGSYSYTDLTNIEHTPNGATNPNYDPEPGPSDVNPPTLTQIWTVAPAIPGDRVFLTDATGDTPPATDIPVVAKFSVTPGTIPTAENTILAETQTQVTGYMDLRAKVIESYSWNWGMSWHDTDKIKRIQDNMLLASAEVIHMAGVYVAKLNDAGQTYAKTDTDSKPPAPS